MASVSSTNSALNDDKPLKVKSGTDHSWPSITMSSDYMDLPREVWTLILDYVPQTDRLYQRLVSKQWCNMVDQCSTFKITYNEIPLHLIRHVLNLRIRGCEFSGIKEEIQPLAHPLLVREITLGAGMTAENTRSILSTCVNVESLRYFVTEKSDTAFGRALSHDYLKSLRRLKSIEIGILFFGVRSTSSICSSLETLIGNQNLVFKGLSEIIIHFKMTTVEFEKFLLFLHRHRKTLHKLGIYRQCICEYKGNEYDEATDNVRGYENFKIFEDCVFSSVILIKGASYKCKCGGELLWSKLLTTQSKVETLCTDLVPNVSVIKEFVQRNTQQLRSVKLYDISLGIDACMNLSVFQNCTQLQELTLQFLSCAVIIMRVGNSAERYEDGRPYTKRYSECIGLQLLPKSLKKLSIKGCDILSSTLKEMSSALRLQNLCLGDPGSPARCDYGVTVDVLLSLIENIPELTCLSVHKNFFNFGQGPKNGQFESDKFYKFIVSLGITKLCNVSISTRNLAGEEVDDPEYESESTVNLTLPTTTDSRLELINRLKSGLLHTN